ncbi:MAG: cation:proton antiporter [Cyclobacteriaceae bacterium]|nr:cation:proton antiporter [Cyclobacteriaceae bacterium]
MGNLDHTEIVNLLIQLGVMILAARLFGELARKLGQPMVVGEIIAGVILGPSILGTINMDMYELLFPLSGNSGIVLEGIISVSVVLLLFIAGMEVELDLVWQQGKKALYTSLFALIIPLVTGFVVSYYFPGLFSLQSANDKLVFSLFIGTTLSITALPVIARVLMDLNIFKTKMGMVIIASAMIIDILGWIIFSIILSMMGESSGSMTVPQTIIATLLFTIVMLTLGKSLINRTLPWVNRSFAWPGGLLSVAMVLCFLAAAFTEYIGIHSIFGAFIIGVALGDSQHMSERAKEIVHQFINNIFGPLFFVSIGLYVNFVTNFNIVIVSALIILALTSKLTGAYIGARLGGLRKYTSLAVGFGMNTHGTLEVILGTIALNSGLITEEVFVAIVIMVIVSILISAPLMKYSLHLAKKEKSIRKKAKLT